MQSKKKKDFIKKQEYPGGISALQRYFRENLQYPEVALKNRVEGKVLIVYTIDFDGSVKGAKVLKGIGYQCDEEALRLVNGLKFAPQNNHGLKVSTSQKIKVEFKLPKIEQKTNEIKTTLQYTVIKGGLKNRTDLTTKKSYSYTINLKK